MTALARLSAVAAGGALGTIGRAALLLVHPPDPAALPWTVLAGNVAGAFALGVVVAVLLRLHPSAEHLRAFLATGVLGSFTTFSAVSLSLVDLAGAGRGASAVAYAAVSVAAGLGAAAAGLATGRGLGRRSAGGDGW